MAIKVKIPRVKGFRGGLKSPILRAGVAAFLIIGLVMFGIFSYYYIKYQKIVDKRFYGPIFANTAKIFAQPRDVRIARRPMAAKSPITCVMPATLKSVSRANPSSAPIAC